MPKRIDFAKQRRDQGRSLTSTVSELKAMMEQAAQQAGINLRAILDEASARKEKDKQLLTERLQESIVPIVHLSGCAARQNWFLRPRPLGFGVLCVYRSARD